MLDISPRIEEEISIHALSGTGNRRAQPSQPRWKGKGRQGKGTVRVVVGCVQYLPTYVYLPTYLGMYLSRIGYPAEWMTAVRESPDMYRSLHSLRCARPVDLLGSPVVRQATSTILRLAAAAEVSHEVFDDCADDDDDIHG